MKTVRTASEFPTKPHFAIMLFETSTVNHEADERSKSNPGHGYPAYSETVRSFTYMAFDEKEEWADALTGLYKDNPKRTDVVAFQAEGRVTTDIVISINPAK